MKSIVKDKSNIFLSTTDSSAATTDSPNLLSITTKLFERPKKTSKTTLSHTITPIKRKSKPLNPDINQTEFKIYHCARDKRGTGVFYSMRIVLFNNSSTKNPISLRCANQI